jgi:hypothetical protein
MNTNAPNLLFWALLRSILLVLQFFQIVANVVSVVQLIEFDGFSKGVRFFEGLVDAVAQREQAKTRPPAVTSFRCLWRFRRGIE